MLIMSFYVYGRVTKTDYKDNKITNIQWKSHRTCQWLRKRKHWADLPDRLNCNSSLLSLMYSQFSFYLPLRNLFKRSELRKHNAILQLQYGRGRYNPPPPT